MTHLCMMYGVNFNPAMVMQAKISTMPSKIKMGIMD